MFTKREQEILGLIAKGFSSQAIAESLFISIETVKTHRKNVIRKAKLDGLQFDSLLRLAVRLVNESE